MADIAIDMTGKLCLVTGATSGIGRETALALARMGAHVVIASRDKGRGEAAVAEIQAATGNKTVDFLLADLSVQSSVRQLATDFLARYDRLDVLVNNAGLLLYDRTITADGLETTFALNHLGYFLLANLLLERLKASAPARVINVASEAGRFSHIAFDDLMSERKYSGWLAYGQSKLANIIFTYELARRLEGTGVTVNAVHPGGVATNFGTRGGGIMGNLFRLARPFMLTAAQGADTVIYLAASPEVAGITGKYWAKRKPLKSSRESYDTETAGRLWEVSARLTGLSE